jgi:hypothetical protein
MWVFQLEHILEHILLVQMSFEQMALASCGRKSGRYDIQVDDTEKNDILHADPTNE